MRMTWKLLPMAVFFILGLLLLSPGLGGRLAPASADVDSISADVLAVPDEGAVTLTVVAVDDEAVDGHDLVVSTSNASTLDIATCLIQDAGGDEPCDAGAFTGDGTTSVTMDDADAEIDVNDDATQEPLILVLILDAECSGGPEVITITAEQDSTAGQFDSVDVLCLPQPNIIIEKEVDDIDDADVTFAFNFDDGVDPADCQVSQLGGAPAPISDNEDFDVTQNDAAEFFCAVNVQYRFTELDLLDDLQLDCDVLEGNVSDAVIVEDEPGHNVEIELLSDDVRVRCTFTNEGELITPTPTPTETLTPTPTATATPTSTVSIPTSLVLVPNPGSVGCNGVSIVAIQLRNGSGAGVAGVTIGLTTTIGSITTTVVTDANGNASAGFTGPSAGNGTAQISAVGGGVTGHASIAIVCATVVTTVVTVAAPAPTQRAAVPPAAEVTIQPPNTGEAGLADGAWRTYAGIFLTAGSVLGAIAVVRKRA